MDPQLTAVLRSLLASPVGALGTLGAHGPFVSMVPVATDPTGAGFFIHVSGLAQHTREVRADARVSLLFVAPLADGQDPLALPRLTLQGRAEELPGDSDEARRAAEAYLARFPQAELTLGLGDFAFFRIRLEAGRLVSGFGRALTLDADQIQAALLPRP